jgi:hypothetical protein
MTMIDALRSILGTQKFMTTYLLDLKANNLQLWVFKGPKIDPQKFGADLLDLKGDLNRSINQQ